MKCGSGRDGLRAELQGKVPWKCQRTAKVLREMPKWSQHASTRNFPGLEVAGPSKPPSGLPAIHTHRCHKPSTHAGFEVPTQETGPEVKVAATEEGSWQEDERALLV